MMAGVPGGVEHSTRRPATGLAGQNVVQQRIDAGSTHIGVFGQIVVDIEIRVRIAPLQPALQQKMLQWLQPASHNVRIAPGVPCFVEQPGLAKQFNAVINHRRYKMLAP